MCSDIKLPDKRDHRVPIEDADFVSLGMKQKALDATDPSEDNITDIAALGLKPGDVFVRSHDLLKNAW